MNKYFISVNFDNKFMLSVSRETFCKYVSKYENPFRTIEYCRQGRVFFLYPFEMSSKMFRRFSKFDAEITREINCK